MIRSTPGANPASNAIGTGGYFLENNEAKTSIGTHKDIWECVAFYTHCPYMSAWHVTSTQGKLDTRQIKPVLSATLMATEQHPGNNILPTQHLATKSRYLRRWSKTALPTVTAWNKPRPKLTLSKHGLLRFLPYEKLPGISELGISNYSWTSPV